MSRPLGQRRMLVRRARSWIGSCRIEIISKNSDEIFSNSLRKLLIYRLAGTFRQDTDEMGKSCGT